MVTIPRGRVIDIRTGNPVPSAQVMIYDATGKLHSTLTTNMRGEFSTAFPAGEYGLTVYAPGFLLATEVLSQLPKSADIMYDGGTFRVNNDEEPLDMIVPVQNEAQGAVPRLGFLRAFWHSIVFSLTKKMNGKNSSYGIVRDSKTNMPLDLAIVRLFDEKTGQLTATRISDIHGKFSLFPSVGTYRMTVTREGYEDALREHIAITDTDNSGLYTPVDLVQKVVL